MLSRLEAGVACRADTGGYREAMSREKASQLLTDAGVRRTRGRLAILAALLRAKTPLTHEELSGRLRGHHLDRVTVYRTLQTLIEKGIAHRVEAGDRLWRFAVCGCGHRVHCHPHFTCRVCGKVECLNDVDLPEFAQVGRNYRVESQEVYMTGVCAHCVVAGC